MAAKDSIPVTAIVKDSNGKRTSRMPGWNEYVAPVRRESMFWHNLWLECGHPHFGVVADCMRRTRASYHYAIRRIRKNETLITQERFARCVLENRNRDFWEEVKRIKNSTKGVSSIVDGVCDSCEIANIFC